MFRINLFCILFRGEHIYLCQGKSKQPPNSGAGGSKLYKTGACHWICGIQTGAAWSMCSHEWGRTHKWPCHPCGLWHHRSASPSAQPWPVLVLWVLMTCTKHSMVSSNTMSHKESLRLVAVKVLYSTWPFDRPFMFPIYTTWLKTSNPVQNISSCSRIYISFLH